MGWLSRLTSLFLFCLILLACRTVPVVPVYSPYVILCVYMLYSINYTASQHTLNPGIYDCTGIVLVYVWMLCTQTDASGLIQVHATLVALQLVIATPTVQWEESIIVTLCLASVCAKLMLTVTQAECVTCARKASSTSHPATLWGAKVRGCSIYLGNSAMNESLLSLVVTHV